MNKTNVLNSNDSSLVKSAFWFLINNVLNIAFPFATGIYVARVLLPESIGVVASAQNIVQYFVIFAFLGIPTYGLREIAKARKNKDELNSIYSELFIINLASTIFFSVAYLVVVLLVPNYRSNLPLYLITGGLVALNAFNNTWLFEGLEKFKFISLRNVVFKAIMFLLLVLFVKNDSNYLMYAAITVIGTAGNYAVNLLSTNKYVHFRITGLNFKRHFRPILFLVAVNLAIEIYSLVDITMLDFFTTKEHIAFYKYGSSIGKILLQVVNTFTMVLIPRISLLYKEKKALEFNRLLSKTFSLIILVSLPMIIGIQFTSTYLICKIYGDEYISSAYVLNVISSTLLITPIGYLLGSRTLLVSGNERLMIIPVAIGALTNVIGNLILIPHYSEIGAAVASLIGEIVVMIVYVLLGKKYFKLTNISDDIFKVAIASILMSVFTLFVCFKTTNSFARCFLEIIVAVFVYFLSLYLLKESHLIEMVGRIKKRFIRKV